MLALFLNARMLDFKDIDSILHLLDALLSAYDAVACANLEELQPTVAIVQELAVLACSECLQSHPGAVASVAEAVASRRAAPTWAAALVQPAPDDILAVLSAVGRVAATAPPASLHRILAQCDVSQISPSDSGAAIKALVAFARPEAAVSSDDDAADLTHAVFARIARLGREAEGCTRDATDALLQIFLAAAQHVSVASMGSSFPEVVDRQGTSPLCLAPMELASFASWAFSAPVGRGAGAPLALRLLEAANWRLLSSPEVGGRLRLKWLFALVVAAKALAAGGDSEALEYGFNLVDSMMVGSDGWRMCRPDAEGAEDAYLFCMLEVRPSYCSYCSSFCTCFWLVSRKPPRQKQYRVDRNIYTTPMCVCRWPSTTSASRRC
jgi:hypothetical protein